MPTAKNKKQSMTFRDIPVDGYQRVVEVIDQASELHAIIAIHDTTLGPTLGGIRAYPYNTFDDALTDVLRLSKGMTYKSAISRCGTGGSKSVIITKDRGPKSEELLMAFGEAVDSLKGEYICAEDVGTTVQDLAVIRRKTRFAVGLIHPQSSGDPSRFTAWGGYQGIRAVAKKLWGNPSLAGKKIAIQGLGAVGMKLANLLFWEGAELIVTDVDAEKLQEAATLFAAQVVAPVDIHAVKCDILTPCAMGGIINPKTIKELRCSAVAGLANNQLLTDAEGDKLAELGILYAPDFAINAGGLINVCAELEPNGYNPASSKKKIDWLYDLMLEIFDYAEKKKISTAKAAREMAENNIRQGIGKRQTPVVFHH